MDKGKIHRTWKKRRLFLVIVIVLLAFFMISKKSDLEREGEQEEFVEDLEIEVEKEAVIDDYMDLTASPDIRVLIKTSNYAQIFHAEVCVTFPDGGYVLVFDGSTWTKNLVDVGESFCVGFGASYDCDMSQGMQVAFVPAKEESCVVIEDLVRSRNVASYYGRLEVSAGNGGLVVVNELPLETYLNSVLPSEMPASYDVDALRAQAILARTYAYKYLISPAYEVYAAHVDDSVMYQVYGNIDEHEDATSAVTDTVGILLFSDNTLADVYFYSTSCGVGATDMVWGNVSVEEQLVARRIGAGVLTSQDEEEDSSDIEQRYLNLLQDEDYFRNFIDVPLDGGYECEESWYRWESEKVPVLASFIETLLKERYAQDPTHILTWIEGDEYESREIASLGEVTDIKILERGVGGVVQSVLVCGTIHTYKIVLEYNIRYILNSSGVAITKQDGTVTNTGSLLPSGFFYLDVYFTNGIVTSYQIFGGGYGHGVGMSQNGANQMAITGMTCGDILKFYFPDSIFVSYVQ
ncbi:MAG: SpoIID/LytB domain-containing protein [Lachnospiraceae bacterium]